MNIEDVKQIPIADYLYSLPIFEYLVTYISIFASD